MPKRVSAPSRRLALTGIVLIAVTIAIAGLSIIERHREAIESRRQELSKLAAVLAEQTARSLQGIDLVLQEIQAKAPGIGAEPDQTRQQLAAQGLRDFLSERVKVLPQAKAIGLLAADGTLVNGSGSPIPAKADFSGRDYFIYLRDHDVPDLYISAPARSLAENWTLFHGPADQRPPRRLCRSGRGIGRYPVL